MSPPALAFVLIAAIFHATWNFIIKKVKEKQIVTWWAIMLGTGASLPFLLPDFIIPVQLWPYILGSALAEAIYYLVLLHAYENRESCYLCLFLC
jgi:hypothetical protein